MSRCSVLWAGLILLLMAVGLLPGSVGMVLTVLFWPVIWPALLGLLLGFLIGGMIRG